MERLEEPSQILGFSYIVESHSVGRGQAEETTGFSDALLDANRGQQSCGPHQNLPSLGPDHPEHAQSWELSRVRSS